MPKIKIKMQVNEEDFTFEGIKSQNSIIYKDADIHVKFKITDVVELIRENSEFRMEMVFDKNNKTKINYRLKLYNTCLTLTLETKHLYIARDYIDILYKIVDNNEDDIHLRLEFEEI